MGKNLLALSTQCAKIREDSTIVCTQKVYNAEIKTSALTFHSYHDINTKTSSTWILQCLACTRGELIIETTTASRFFLCVQNREFVLKIASESLLNQQDRKRISHRLRLVWVCGWGGGWRVGFYCLLCFFNFL